jgi:hypothetical protein
MGQGSFFFERFRHYMETGGVAKWKNTVVSSVRSVQEKKKHKHTYFSTFSYSWPAFLFSA